MRYRGDGAQIALLGSQAPHVIHDSTGIQFLQVGEESRTRLSYKTLKLVGGRDDSEIQYSITRLVVLA
jgi:hypothetical protein